MYVWLTPRLKSKKIFFYTVKDLLLMECMNVKALPILLAKL